MSDTHNYMVQVIGWSVGRSILTDEPDLVMGDPVTSPGRECDDGFIRGDVVIDGEWSSDSPLSGRAVTIVGPDGDTLEMVEVSVSRCISSGWPSTLSPLNVSWVAESGGHAQAHTSPNV
jgi:hypothetical protein